MLRLAGYFLLVLLALQILRFVPFVGSLFRIPFFGFWGAAIVVSLALSKLATIGVDRRRLKRKKLELGAVDTPHNQGKLGTLLLAAGDAHAAIPALVKAAAGEPQSAEWSYRLGLAWLDAGRTDEAIAALERAAQLDPEHAYGAVQMRLAEALSRAARHAEALDVLDRFERDHGPNPESAYRRGFMLRALGRRSEARASFDQVSRLASKSARFQRSASRGWVLRSWIARLT